MKVHSLFSLLVDYLVSQSSRKTRVNRYRITYDRCTCTYMTTFETMTFVKKVSWFIIKHNDDGVPSRNFFQLILYSFFISHAQRRVCGR